MITIWTIGHSTRTIEEFLDLLRNQSIETLVDVRRYPGSRKNPQYNPDALQDSLATRDIEYLPMDELGGRRKPRPDSANSAWRNLSFRGYADYMETAEFQSALDRLMTLASKKRVAIMCSEAVWWRCHRSMIADALKVRGVRVLHIMNPGEPSEHPFTSPARVVDGDLTYEPAG